MLGTGLRNTDRAYCCHYPSCRPGRCQMIFVLRVALGRGVAKQRNVLGAVFFAHASCRNWGRLSRVEDQCQILPNPTVTHKEYHRRTLNDMRVRAWFQCQTDIPIISEHR